MAISFDYWNGVDPGTFLVDDWTNDARAWAGRAVARAIDAGAKTMVEVGPGPGIDYVRQFQPLVASGKIAYTGWEGSRRLADNLRRLGAAHVECRPLLDLPPRAFDLVYAKAVLEHQPALEPSLDVLLASARMTALINWYRPPAATAAHTESAGVHYWTFRRDDVLAAVAKAGFSLTETARGFRSGNECWQLTRMR